MGFHFAGIQVSGALVLLVLSHKNENRVAVVSGVEGIIFCQYPAIHAEEVAFS